MHTISTELSTSEGPADLSPAVIKLLHEILLVCGSGTGPALVQLASHYRDPRIWQIVAARLRQNPPRVSALGYVRKILPTADRDLAALDAAASPGRRRGQLSEADRALLDQTERERLALLAQVEAEAAIPPPPPVERGRR